MNTITRQWLLWIIAVSGAFVGVWALFAPVSWYDSFPGLGLRWLPPLGPYNEHLARDVGAFFLALTALSVGTALRPANEYLVRLTGVVWLVFSVPHLLFHLLHLSMYGPLDQVLNVLSLGLFVVIGAALLLPVRAGRRPEPLSRAGGGSG
jgi:hypothetical protein